MITSFFSTSEIVFLSLAKSGQPYNIHCKIININRLQMKITFRGGPQSFMWRPFDTDA